MATYSGPVGVCSLSYFECSDGSTYPQRKFLPQVAVSAHTSILSTVSRTTLKQAYVNPSDKIIDELRYTFPLFNGVSVVGFTFTINNDRVIKGVVKEKQEARQEYQEAVDAGKTAGLFEQLPDASDVFTTSIGNVPARAEIVVDITYLGELQHDAEVDGIRLTIPTSIAPRYGSYPGELLQRPTNVSAAAGIQIVVDAEMPAGCNIISIQSPSHPISVSVGNVSTAAATDEMSLSKASATLSLGTAELDKDFILLVAAPHVNKPVAILETHPRYPSQRALMATLVPKFNIPESRPEIVFICDRSGSMSTGQNIPNLKAALNVFLKSLPVGVKFNICSFGTRYEFLFPNGSQSYNQQTMEQAVRYVETFSANFGGTEMYRPISATFEKRYKDMDLEVFLLTDGEVWRQEELFELINAQVRDSKGATRVFTLGIGASVSHSLIQGLARSGNGFSQAVADNEKMNNKVVKMLKAALTPHVTDYSLEVKYGHAGSDEKMRDDGDLDDYELVENLKTEDSLVIRLKNADPYEMQPKTQQKPISLFDRIVDATSASDDKDSKDAANKYSHVPEIEPPKILQSPINIPPLFPSSRATVYLLMAPDASERAPKAVIYRGTSRHGPLELEIPVTALSTPGETIHQLAARAACTEMEEHRGWIYEAKADGILLKEKFQGRFPDMVEREAARLGVQFQIGNKWCSFVAIDQASGQEAVKPKAPEVPEKKEVQASFQTLDFYSDRGGTGHAKYRLAPSVQARPAGRRMVMGHAAMPLPPPAPAPMMSASYAAIPTEVVLPQTRSRGASSRRSMGVEYMLSDEFESADFCAPLPGNNSPLAENALLVAQRRDVRPSVPKRKSTSSRASDYKQPIFAKMAMVIDHNPKHVSDLLLELVNLQKFDGSWAATEQLFQLIGTTKASVQLAFVSKYGGNVWPTDSLVTAATVSYLKEKMADREDEWEMLVQKAIGWLNSLRVSMSGDELVETAAVLFRSG